MTISRATVAFTTKYLSKPQWNDTLSPKQLNSKLVIEPTISLIQLKTANYCGLNFEIIPLPSCKGHDLMPIFFMGSWSSVQDSTFQIHDDRWTLLIITLVTSQHSGIDEVECLNLKEGPTLLLHSVNKDTLLVKLYCYLRRIKSKRRFYPVTLLFVTLMAKCYFISKWCLKNCIGSSQNDFRNS